MTANTLPAQPQPNFQAELRARGLGFLVAAIVFFIFWRDPVSLILLGLLGLLNLVLPRRPVFIVNGILITLIAVSNVLAALFSMLAAQTSSNGVLILGVHQFGWAVQEFEKFARFAPKTPEYKLLIQKLNSRYETARLAAAQELGRLVFSNEVIVNELQAATQDEYISVRQAASEALRAQAHQAWIQQQRQANSG